MSDLRFLETIRSPGELNRLLIQIQEFCESDRLAKKERLELALKEAAFQGGFVQFDDLINLAFHFRLIHISEDGISLTPTGETFLVQNPQNQYNLTDGQKHLLVQSILFQRSPISKQFELILEDFTYNVKTDHFESRIVATSGLLKGLGIRLFCSAIDFIREADDGTRFFDPDFNTDIMFRIRIFRQTGMDGQVPTEETLRRSKYAEELVFLSEKSRLIDEGFPELSRRVQWVSEYNSAAGYDIQSYEGVDSLNEIPDRFIEVKSSKDEEFGIFFSRNERKKAIELREQYRIAFIGKCEIGVHLKDCSIRTIIDPELEIFIKKNYKLDAPKFFITEKDSEIEIREVKEDDQYNSQIDPTFRR